MSPDPYLALAIRILEGREADPWPLLDDCHTIAELEAALADFEGCALKHIAVNTVFAGGTTAGPVMLIGEAPSADDDRTGQPFFGTARRLFDRELSGARLSRHNMATASMRNQLVTGPSPVSPKRQHPVTQPLVTTVTTVITISIYVSKGYG